MRHFVFRWFISAIAVTITPAFVGGIRYDTAGALILAALLLGILNAFVRPVLLILSVPLILVALGVAILIVNATMLYVIPDMVVGFRVDGFWSVFWGSIWVSIISWVLSSFFRGSDGRIHILTHHTQVKAARQRRAESRSRPHR